MAPTGRTEAGSVSTLIHLHVAAARRGQLARVVTRVSSGWVVLGDPQILAGYCLLLPDPVVAHLNALEGTARRAFLDDMARLGDAVLSVTGAERINYEILGNVEPALHAHVIPRYAWEAPERRRAPVWLHDWTKAAPFDAAEHAVLARGIRSALERMTNHDPHR
jgi:diadenosine tetraphosphate (Ap4A) HIT family hydrolase